MIVAISPCFAVSVVVAMTTLAVALTAVVAMTVTWLAEY